MDARLERVRREIDAHLEREYRQLLEGGFVPSVSPITIHDDADVDELCSHCGNLMEFCTVLPH